MTGNVIFGRRDASAARAEMRRRVDAMVEARRTSLMPPGQDATYTRKVAEAERFLDRKEGRFPLLEAESRARGLDITKLAALILKKSEKWGETLTLLEIERVKSSQELAASQDASEMYHVVARLGDRLVTIEA